jgi:hypothetical protein
MSQGKILNIPVNAVLEADTRLIVALKSFGQLTDEDRQARIEFRWSPKRQEEAECGQLYVWNLSRRSEIDRVFGDIPRATSKYLLPRAKLAPHVRRLDVYEVRDRFFSIATPEQGLQFFQQCGAFGIEHAVTFGFRGGLSFADLVQWQSLLKSCRTHEPDTWSALTKPYELLKYAKAIQIMPDFSIRLTSPLRLQVRCNFVRDAIIAANYLDKLQDIRSDECARRDCRRVFNRESGHQRKYCSSDCAHLEAVRRSRAKKAGA